MTEITDYSVFATYGNILEGIWINSVVIVFNDGEGNTHRALRVVRTPIYDKELAEEMRLDLEARTKQQLKEGWFTVEELLDDQYGDWREIPLHT